MPPAVPVIFTTVDDVTALVVTANVWVVEPAETWMLGNTDAAALLLLDKVTVVPP